MVDSRPAEDEVRPGPDDAIRRRLEQVAGRTAVRQHRPADQQRHQQRRERGADEVRLPPTPAHERTDEAGHDPAERRPEQEVGVLVATQDEQRVVERPGERRADQHDETDREPAVRPAEGPKQLATLRRGHETRTSPNGRPGTIEWALSSYSASACNSARRRLAASSSATASWGAVLPSAAARASASTRP